MKKESLLLKQSDIVLQYHFTNSYDGLEQENRYFLFVYLFILALVKNAKQGIKEG